MRLLLLKQTLSWRSWKLCNMLLNKEIGNWAITCILERMKEVPGSRLPAPKFRIYILCIETKESLSTNEFRTKLLVTIWVLYICAQRRCSSLIIPPWPFPSHTHSFTINKVHIFGGISVRRNCQDFCPFIEYNLVGKKKKDSGCWGRCADDDDDLSGLALLFPQKRLWIGISGSVKL